MSLASLPVPGAGKGGGGSLDILDLEEVDMALDWPVDAVLALSAVDACFLRDFVLAEDGSAVVVPLASAAAPASSVVDFDLDLDDLARLAAVLALSLARTSPMSSTTRDDCAALASFELNPLAVNESANELPPEAADDASARSFDFFGGRWMSPLVVVAAADDAALVPVLIS